MPPCHEIEAFRWNPPPNIIRIMPAALHGQSDESAKARRSGDWGLNTCVALALENEHVLKRRDMLQGGINEANNDRFLTACSVLPNSCYLCSAPAEFT